MFFGFIVFFHSFVHSFIRLFIHRSLSFIERLHSVSHKQNHSYLSRQNTKMVFGLVKCHVTNSHNASQTHPFIIQSARRDRESFTDCVCFPSSTQYTVHSTITLLPKARSCDKAFSFCGKVRR